MPATRIAVVGLLATVSGLTCTERPRARPQQQNPSTAAVVCTPTVRPDVDYGVLVDSDSTMNPTPAQATGTGIGALRDLTETFREHHGCALPYHIEDLPFPTAIQDFNTDGWGRRFAYRTSSASLEIRSAGPNGIKGDSDDMVFTWQAPVPEP